MTKVPIWLVREQDGIEQECRIIAHHADLALLADLGGNRAQHGMPTRGVACPRVPDACAEVTSPAWDVP